MNWLAVALAATIAVLSGVGVLILWCAAGGLYRVHDDEPATAAIWLGGLLYIIGLVGVYAVARLLH